MVVDDTSADLRTTESYDTTYRPIGMRSLISVPLLRDGAWATTLVVAIAREIGGGTARAGTHRRDPM